jgi:hypothetical protein
MNIYWVLLGVVIVTVLGLVVWDEIRSRPRARDTTKPGH